MCQVALSFEVSGELPSPESLLMLITRPSRKPLRPPESKLIHRSDAPSSDVALVSGTRADKLYPSIRRRRWDSIRTAAY